MEVLKSNVSVNIDADVKELSVNLLKRMGIDLTTAVDMFLRQIITENRLPFQPCAYNAADERSLNEKLLDQRLSAAIRSKNIPEVAWEFDENGEIIIDKDKDPELYNWVVNG